MSTNILQEIKNLISSLKADPNSLDIDGLINTLSSAYRLASDGLQRSQAASKLPGALKEVESLKVDNQDLRTQLDSINPKLTAAENELQNFAPLLADLKTKLTGKVNLLPTYSDEFKTEMQQQIDAADVSAFLSLQVRFEDEFRIAFTGQPLKTLSPTKGGNGTVIHPKFYQSGG